MSLYKRGNVWAGEVHQPAVCQGAAEGAETSGHREFPVARSAPHLGELARSERRPAKRHSGDGWMGNAGDGAALRASLPGASGASRTPVGRTHRHKFGTVTKL